MINTPPQSTRAELAEKFITEFRKHLTLGITQVAQQAGLDYNTVRTLMFSTETEPLLNPHVQIAMAFGLDLNTLFNYVPDGTLRASVTLDGVKVQNEIRNVFILSPDAGHSSICTATGLPYPVVSNTLSATRRFEMKASVVRLAMAFGMDLNALFNYTPSVLR